MPDRFVLVLITVVMIQLAGAGLVTSVRLSKKNP
jgi:hypothetical protein